MSQRTPSAWRADVDQRVDRGLAQPGRERVELGDVRPRREVRVAAAGDHGVADGEEAAGSRARSSALPWTKYSGCSASHGWSGATWLGTKSTSRRTPRAASAGPGGGQARPGRRSGRRPRSRGCSRPSRSRRRPSRSARAAWKRRHAGSAMSSASRTPAGLRSHTPISHTASTPGGVTESHSPAGHVGQASPAARPARPTSWSQAAVLSS